MLAVEDAFGSSVPDAFVWSWFLWKWYHYRKEIFCYTQ